MDVWLDKRTTDYLNTHNYYISMQLYFAFQYNPATSFTYTYYPT